MSENEHEKKSTPTVFISSTVEDLKLYRLAARDAAIRAQFLPVMCEYFAAGNNPPLKACLEKVDGCDVLVVIVAQRYGWIPLDQPNGEQKSITWIECERALANGIEIIPFFLDPTVKWPEEAKEMYRLTKAMEEGRSTPELYAEVLEANQGLKTFKDWLSQDKTRALFNSEADLGLKMTQSLYEWRERHHDKYETVPVAADPYSYLSQLLNDCASINIQGLQVSSGKAYKFGIEELYIPLKTAGAAGLKSKRRKTEPEIEAARRTSLRAPHRQIELHEILPQKHVTVIGDPGAGKTTFLRRIAFALCQTLLNIEPGAARARLGLSTAPFPVFIRLGEFSAYLRNCKDEDIPALPTDPAWLTRFLEYKCQNLASKLTADFFAEKLRTGTAMVLLDGLDEAPDRLMRERVSALVRQAVAAWGQCYFVVTSRPLAYTGLAVLEDFSQYTIDSLDLESIRQFLWHWSMALHEKNEISARPHHDELMQALTSRAEIRRMATNPVMLTALAVVHYNERRIPEQRVDLYDSIITWLLRSREQREGRASVDDCRRHLQNLALKMHLHPDGRQVQVGHRWAAEAIQDGFADAAEEQRLARAEKFLAEEEVDSGIVVGRGNALTFWHLTFMEYLAARALAAKGDQDQQALLIKPAVLHNPDWREALLLFGGTLYRQGLDKINNFFRAILDTVRPGKSLADEARCVGLLGAMLRDLEAFPYELKDPRYRQMLDRVMAIFNKDQARKLDLKVRLEAADALGQAGDPRLAKDNMICIPAGTFLMGAQKEKENASHYDSEAYDDESPVHKVSLSAYCICRFPVTVGEYQRFSADGGNGEQSFWAAGGFGQFTEPEDWAKLQSYPSRPVVGVSWYEAMAYACWSGKTLPTEAQWERAARGPGKVYRKYPWGDAAPDGQNTNSNESKLGHPAPVGMFKEDCSEEGVLDLGGNVLEWCLDWYDNKYYEACNKRGGVIDNPTGPETGSSRVLRGGCWGLNSRYCRSAGRNRVRPENRLDFVGFRLVFVP